MAIIHLLQMKDINHTWCNHLGLITGERYVDAGKVSVNHVQKKIAGALCMCVERDRCGVLSHIPRMRDGTVDNFDKL